MKTQKKKNKNFEKRTRNIFLSVLIVDVALLALFTYLIYFVVDYHLTNEGSEIVTLIVLAIVFVVFSYIFLKMIHRELIEIEYTRTNIYLFRKFIFLYEALITVFLTFLLGVNSSLLSLFEIEDEILDFSINACLVIASCIATSTKVALEYTYTTWEFDHTSKGDKSISS